MIKLIKKDLEKDRFRYRPRNGDLWFYNRCCKSDAMGKRSLDAGTA